MEVIIALILVFIALIQFFVALAVLLDGDFENSFCKVFLTVSSLVVFILFLVLMGKPRAIDVYKGRTTLEITYKDKVPIDTTLVWKNK